MKFKIVPPELEIGELVLPFAEHVKLQVHRLGYRPYQSHVEARQRPLLAAAAKKAAGALAKKVAGAGGEVDDDTMAEYEAVYVRESEALAASEEFLSIFFQPDIAGAVLLVASVEGLETEEGPAVWSPEVGFDLLEQYPVIRELVFARAKETEDGFQAFVGAAGKNSDASSATSEPVAGDATN